MSFGCERSCSSPRRVSNFNSKVPQGGIYPHIQFERDRLNIFRVRVFMSSGSTGGGGDAKTISPNTSFGDIITSHQWLDEDDDEVGLKERPEDTRCIKKITSNEDCGLRQGNSVARDLPPTGSEANTTILFFIYIGYRFPLSLSTIVFLSKKIFCFLFPEFILFRNVGNSIKCKKNITPPPPPPQTTPTFDMFEIKNQKGIEDYI